jgi:hypothetical protein
MLTASAKALATPVTGVARSVCYVAEYYTNISVVILMTTHCCCFRISIAGSYAA